MAGNAALLLSDWSRGLHIHDNTQVQFTGNCCARCTAELNRRQSRPRRSETAYKRLLRSLALSGTGPAAASDWAIEPHWPCYQLAEQPKVGTFCTGSVWEACQWSFDSCHYIKLPKMRKVKFYIMLKGREG